MSYQTNYSDKNKRKRWNKLASTTVYWKPHTFILSSEFSSIFPDKQDKLWAKSINKPNEHVKSD